MTYRAPLLALIAAGLLVVIGLELSPWWGAAPPQGRVETPPPPGNGRADAGGNDGGAIAEILARPLFRADRRAPPSDGAGSDGHSVDLPRLSGIVIAADSRRAIFQPAGANRTMVVAVGETVGGWRVEQIAADAVTVTGAAGTYRLTPKFDSQATATGPANGPAPRPALPGPAPAPNFANMAQPGLPGADPRLRAPGRGPSPDGSIFGGASGSGNP